MFNAAFAVAVHLMANAAKFLNLQPGAAVVLDDTIPVNILGTNFGIRVQVTRSQDAAHDPQTQPVTVPNLAEMVAAAVSTEVAKPQTLNTIRQLLAPQQTVDAVPAAPASAPPPVAPASSFTPSPAPAATDF